MAEAAVDGVFLQRNLFDCDMEKMGPAYRHLRDEVGDRVREAAEAEGRVFAYMCVIHSASLARCAELIHDSTGTMSRTLIQRGCYTSLRKTGSISWV